MSRPANDDRVTVAADNLREAARTLAAAILLSKARTVLEAEATLYATAIKYAAAVRASRDAP